MQNLSSYLLALVPLDLGCADTAPNSSDAGREVCVYCPPDCQAEGADLIYVLDEQYVLSTFDPAASARGEEAFSQLGTLRCDSLGLPLPGVSTTWAYSMSSDRNGHLWIAFTSGE